MKALFLVCTYNSLLIASSYGREKKLKKDRKKAWEREREGRKEREKERERERQRRLYFCIFL